uniref:Uncharacterized protein n=1 Tax=Aplanochytrium stocchinoi TaxID=215587 RepID=A0A7S3PKE3_9STRA
MDEERAAFVSDRIVEVLKAEFGLGDLGIGIMQKWMRKMAVDDPEGNLKRVRAWLIEAFNRKSSSVSIKDDSINKWQRGCPDIVPNLTARPFWCTRFTPKDDLYYFLRKLAANADRICKELVATKGKKLFQPYRAPNWVRL